MLFPSAGMLAAAAAMALHEGGHVLAMALCGVRECRIELTPFGGVADVPGFERLPARRQCLIALAGVPVSAASAWLCLRFAPQTEFFRLFYRFSMGMALVNVLPVWPLDGARVLLCGARWFGREEPARRDVYKRQTSIRRPFPRIFWKRRKKKTGRRICSICRRMI